METRVAVIAKRRNWKDGDESGSDREVLQRGTYRIKEVSARVYVGFIPTRVYIVMVINTTILTSYITITNIVVNVYNCFFAIRLV